jgi:sugar-specific transcriptional regulator TrmB
MPSIDLTPFGFTPTESRLYEVLITHGPGTGYALAQAAGLARANAYSALEGLVAKGAARMEEGRPKQFRPEPPDALLARLSLDQTRALDALRDTLQDIALPPSPTLIEIDGARGALRVIAHDLGRAGSSVRLLAPGDAYPILGPVLRRAVSAGLAVRLASSEEATLPFSGIDRITLGTEWPGSPLISIVDDRVALMANRTEDDVRGHWSSMPAFVAGARLAFDRLLSGP